MTRYAPLWQQAGSYPASLDRQLLATIWPNGGATGGVVTAVANTMTLSVAPGTVAVPLQSGQGAALCRWDAAEIVTIAAAPPSGQSRIDLIVVQVRDNTLDSGGNNDFIVTAVTGTPATTGAQVAPAVPANAYALAQVLVGPSIANLNTATITDLRTGPLAAGNRRVKAYATANQSVPAATQTTVTYAATEYNTAGADMNVGTGVFTCSVPGRYRVSASVVTNITLSATPFTQLLTFVKNGAVYLRGMQLVSATGSTSYNSGLNGYAEMDLAAGDTVLTAIQGNQAFSTLGGAPYVQMTVSLIGPT